MERSCFSIIDPCDQIMKWSERVFHRTSAPCYGPSLAADVSELPMVDRNGHLVTDLRFAINNNKISKNKRISVEDLKE